MIKKNPQRAPIPIETYPMFDKSLFEDVIPINQSYLTIASKGCPYVCSFCSESFKQPIHSGSHNEEGSAYTTSKQTHYEFKSVDDFIEDTLTTSRYDKLGNCITKSKKDNLESQKSSNTKYKYKYNDNDQIIDKLKNHFGYNMGKWEKLLNERKQYLYNADGRIHRINTYRSGKKYSSEHRYYSEPSKKT